MLLIFICQPIQVFSQEDDNSAKQQKVKLPDPLEFYKGRRIAPTMSFLGANWLIRSRRQREEDCETLLKELKLKPGMIVCDMGCGNGFYALRMAEMVAPRGKVLAVDIQPQMLRLLQARAAEEKIDNIEPILGTLIDPNLPHGKVDLILCADVYHEFSHPEHMLRAMREALSPNGTVVLAEFREEDPTIAVALKNPEPRKKRSPT